MVRCELSKVRSLKVERRRTQHKQGAPCHRAAASAQGGHGLGAACQPAQGAGMLALQCMQKGTQAVQRKVLLLGPAHNKRGGLQGRRNAIHTLGSAADQSMPPRSPLGAKAHPRALQGTRGMEFEVWSVSSALPGLTNDSGRVCAGAAAAAARAAHALPALRRPCAYAANGLTPSTHRARLRF